MELQKAGLVTPKLEDALSHLQCVLIAHRAYYAPEQVNWPQYNVLELLRIRGDMAPSQIAHQISTSRPTASKLLKSLKSLGFIDQKQDRSDGRAHMIHLTEAGYAFLERAAIGRHEAAQKVSTVLSKGEQAIFAEMSQKITQALQLDNMPPIQK